PVERQQEDARAHGDQEHEQGEDGVLEGVSPPPGHLHARRVYSVHPRLLARFICASVKAMITSASSQPSAAPAPSLNWMNAYVDGLRTGVRGGPLGAAGLSGPKRTYGSVKICSVPIVLTTRTKSVTGRMSGKVTWTKRRQALAPSIEAAAYKSSGMLCR